MSITRYSELLGQAPSPDVDQVAQGLAHKFNWRFLLSGEAVLSLPGLSPQVPTRRDYLSDGPSREYALGKVGDAVGGTALVFCKSAFKVALGRPSLFAFGNCEGHPGCSVQERVNAFLAETMAQTDALLVQHFADVSCLELSR